MVSPFGGPAVVTGWRGRWPRAASVTISYYRVATFPIHVPPLRDRREDIPLLVWSVIERRQTALGRRIATVPKRVMAR